MQPIAIMGVSGAGKSLIGAALAEQLGMPFIDADSLHSHANLVKMSAGIPLEDADRWPWLDEVGRRLSALPVPVVACSALRRVYRDRIRERAPHTVFVHLDVGTDVLRDRLDRRAGHFMPPSLLASQVQTLEALEPTERGFRVDASLAPASLVAKIVSILAAETIE
jgi:carbohydrate kinase (thermoresistant glucokinase family)